LRATLVWGEGETEVVGDTVRIATQVVAIRWSKTKGKENEKLPFFVV